MYVALLTYTAPIEEIDYVLPDHAEWLSRHFEHGNFLAAGRREPEPGGVIIVRAMSRGKLDALLATDPFVLRHLAAYTVVGFTASRTAAGLGPINELLPH